MVWTKHHIASTTEKCGRAKFTRSCSLKVCLAHTDLAWTFLKLSNTTTRPGPTATAGEGRLLRRFPSCRSHSPSPRTVGTSSVVQRTPPPALLFLQISDMKGHIFNSLRESTLFPLFRYNITKLFHQKVATLYKCWKRIYLKGRGFILQVG